jgi:hypothetical protein
VRREPDAPRREHDDEVRPRELRDERDPQQLMERSGFRSRDPSDPTGVFHRHRTSV